MSEVIRSLRMYSPSVRAAEKLPPSIKTQSVQNALLKAGAKPIELEYANLGRYLQSHGDRVRGEDVRRHLETHGPLGRIQRLDAEGPSPEYTGDESWDAGEQLDEDQAVEARREAQRRTRELNDDALRFTAMVRDSEPMYDMQESRLPADSGGLVQPGRAWPSTMFGAYTESQAHGWSDDGYREIYWLDPKTTNRNKPFRDEVFKVRANPGPVNAHDTDMWVRYHVNQDPNLGSVLDVQNVQSDAGQLVSRMDGRRRASGNASDLYYGYSDRASSAEDAVHVAANDIKQWLADRDGTLRYLLGWSADNPKRLLNESDIIGAIAHSADPYPAAQLVLDTWPDNERDQLMQLIARRNELQRVLQSAQHHEGRYKKDLIGRGLMEPDSQRARNESALRGGIVPSEYLREDNWMQVPLRHLLLESAARDGIPIRLPLGVNVRGLEGMPRRAAALMYQRTMPRAMQSILRPIGGGDVAFTPGAKKISYDWTLPNQDPDARTLYVGPNGERAGTTIRPSKKAVEYIQKYGMPFASLLLAPAVTGQGEKK